MIESIIIVLIIISVILMVLSVEWESITFGFIDTIFWLILCIGMFEIEVPYQYVDINSGVAVASTQSLQSMYPIGWLFMLLSLVMFLYSCVQVFETLKGHRVKKIM